ncbi:hypothetical protein [Streptomyces sp. NPDC054834]
MTAGPGAGVEKSAGPGGAVESRSLEAHAMTGPMARACRSSATETRE